MILLLHILGSLGFRNSVMCMKTRQDWPLRDLRVDCAKLSILYPDHVMTYLRVFWYQELWRISAFPISLGVIVWWYEMSPLFVIAISLCSVLGINWIIWIKCDVYLPPRRLRAQAVLREFLYYLSKICRNEFYLSAVAICKAFKQYEYMKLFKRLSDGFHILG